MGLLSQLLCHLWTCPMRSMMAEPVSGTEFSGQSVYWKCFTSREDSSFVSTIFNSLRKKHSIKQHERNGVAGQPESVVRVGGGANEDDLQIVILTSSTAGPVHVAFHLVSEEQMVHSSLRETLSHTLTFPSPSLGLVSMTMVELLCSHTILQKSLSVSGSGP